MTKQFPGPSLDCGGDLVLSNTWQTYVLAPRDRANAAYYAKRDNLDCYWKFTVEDQTQHNAIEVQVLRFDMPPATRTDGCVDYVEVDGHDGCDC